MRTRPYNVLVIALAMCIQTILGSASAAAEAEAGNDRITEQKILSIEKALDDALMQRSVAAYVLHLADNFVFSTEQPGLLGSSVVKMTRREFAAGLAKNLPATTYRSIDHQEREIVITKDGREAFVTQKNIETVAVRGKDIKAITAAKYKYESRDGRVVVASLAESQLEQQETEASFAEADFAPYRGDGPAIVEGEAFVKTENGDVRNCSGETVYLAPGTPFDFSVITAFFFSSIDLALKKAGEAAPYWRESICDSQGKFAFTDLPTGTWIAITAVRWGGRGHVEGGLLGQKITLRPGKNRILMTMKNLRHPILGLRLE